MSESEQVKMDWVTDGVSFKPRAEGLIIRDRVGETSVHRLISLLLFAVAAAVGAGYLADGVREVRAHGLLAPGKTDAMAYVGAIGGLALVLGIVGAVVLAWARPVFGGHEILQISADAIVLTNVDFGMKWRRLQFRRDEVSDVEYVAVSSSDTSDIYAIRFRAGRRRVSVFRYIRPGAAGEVIEAMRMYRAL